MGGSVSVYSKVGVGTKFVITLSLNAFDKIKKKQISNSSNQFSINNQSKKYSQSFKKNFEEENNFNENLEI